MTEWLEENVDHKFEDEKQVGTNDENTELWASLTLALNLFLIYLNL